MITEIVRHYPLHRINIHTHRLPHPSTPRHPLIIEHSSQSLIPDPHPLNKITTKTTIVYVKPIYRRRKISESKEQISCPKY